MKLKSQLSIASCFAKAKLFKIRTPIALSWAVTYRCNYKCKYCKDWNLKTDEVSTSKALEIIDKLRQLGLQRINFTGGEPLVKDNIYQLINYAKEKGIFVCLNSNGSLVSQNIQKLKQLDMLILSIEGSEEIHDLIRQKDSFQSIILAVKAAQSNNLKVRFSATLNKLNSDYIEDLILLANQFHTSVAFQPINFYFLKTKEHNPLLAQKDVFVEAVKRIIRYKMDFKYRNNISNSFSGLKYLLDWPDLKPMDCAFGKIFFRIDPNGKMYPCIQQELQEHTIDLTKLETEKIKKKINDINLDFQCSCGCSNRIEANLAWNLRLQSGYESFKL
ncbi:MAG: radical SAM protein [Candidatus Kaelpia aquatica]|nr:radical SAM protein [Candidatus Kaelpia aquatica]